MHIMSAHKLDNSNIASITIQRQIKTTHDKLAWCVHLLRLAACDLAMFTSVTASTPPPPGEHNMVASLDINQNYPIHMTYQRPGNNVSPASRNDTSPLMYPRSQPPHLPRHTPHYCPSHGPYHHLHGPPPRKASVLMAPKTDSHVN